MKVRTSIKTDNPRSFQARCQIKSKLFHVGLRLSSLTGLIVVDTNANGIRDYVFVNHNNQWEVRFDDPHGSAGATQPVAIDWSVENLTGLSRKAIPLDVNGDGRTDLLQMNNWNDDQTTRVQLLMANGNGFWTLTTNIYPGYQSVDDFYYAAPADINGDGFDDIVAAAGNSGEFKAYLSDGSTLASTPVTGALPDVAGGYEKIYAWEGQIVPIQFDSDGIVDILVQSGGGCWVEPYVVGEVCEEYHWSVYSYSATPDSNGHNLIKVATVAIGNGSPIYDRVKPVEVNGDGLTDLIFDNGSAGNNISWDIYVSTGEAYDKKFTQSAITPHKISDLSVPSGGMAATAFDYSSAPTLSIDTPTLWRSHALDYNHDGLTDILVDVGESTWHVLLATNSSVIPSYDQVIIDTGIPVQDKNKTFVVDVGGDGLPDLVSVDLVPPTQNPANDWMHVHHHRGKRPGLIESIENGLGHEVRIGYSPLTDPSVYLGHTNFIDDGTGVQFPYRDVFGPLVVVKQSTQSDGVSTNGVLSTLYEYLGAKAHIQGRGFLGFSEMRVFNENRETESTTKYWQKFPNSGMASEVVQRISDATGTWVTSIQANAAIQGLFEYPAICETAPTNTACAPYFRPGDLSPAGQTGTGDLIAKTIYSLDSLVTHNGMNGVGASVLPFIQKITELSYPVETATQTVSSAVFKRIRTTYHTATDPMDAYGNPTKIKVVVDNGTTGGNKHTTETTNQWDYSHVNANQWCTSQLSNSTVVSSAPNFSQTTRTTSYTYDGNCSLLTQTVMPGDALEAHTVFTHDVHGNKSSETISGPSFVTATSSTLYGTQYHGRFPTQATNEEGHIIDQSWDVRVGQRTVMEGPRIGANGTLMIATWGYDGFGREIAANGPRPGVAASRSYEWCSVAGCDSATAVIKTTVDHSDGSQQSEEIDSLGRSVHSTTLSLGAQVVHVDRALDILGREYAVSSPYLASQSGSRCYAFRQFDGLSRLVYENRPNQGSQCQLAAPPAADINPVPSNGSRRIFAHDKLVSQGLESTVNTETTGLFSGGETWRVRREVRNVMAWPVLISEDWNSTTVDSTYVYFADGNIKSITDAENHQTQFTYDVLGQKSSVSDPNSGDWSYYYNALGQLIWQLDEKQQRTGMEYDKIGRLTKRIDQYNLGNPSDPNQFVSDWIYDTASGNGIGRIASSVGPYRLGDGETSAEYKESYIYNDYGQPLETIRKISDGGFSDYYWMSSTYDSLGRTRTLTYPARNGDATPSSAGTGRFPVTYYYSSEGLLREVRNGSRVYWRATAMNAFGNVTEFRNEASFSHKQIITVRSYDQATGLMTGTSALHGSNATTVQSHIYQWTDAGDLERREDLKHGYHEELIYDELQRLETSTVKQSTTVLRTVGMTYSATGRVLQKGSAYSGYVYDPAHPYAIKSVVANGATRNYGYDANGNMTSRAGSSVSWSSYDKPTEVNSGALRSRFAYGPQRQRFRHIAERGDGTDTTIYVGGLYEQVTTTRSGASSPEYRHHISAGTEVVAIQTYWDTAGDRVEYLHKDHVGSVTAISNEATITNIAYDAWGKRYDPADLPLLGNLVPGSFLSLDLTLTSLTRGFTSHEQLEHLGLVHMNARVYDPEIGRFLSPDPVVQDIYSTQTINRYSYVRNRPLSAVDPSGAIDLPFDTFFEFSWIEFVKWAATETMDHYVTKYLNEQQQKQLIKQSNYSQGIVKSIMNAAGIPGFGTLPNFSDIFELSPEDLILNIQSSGSGLGRGSGRDGDSGAAIGLRQLAGLLGRFHSGSDAAAKGDAGVSVSTDNPVSREVETGEGAQGAQENQLSHEYQFETEICSRSGSACTPGNVWKSVKNNSVPFQDGELTDGAFNKIPGIGTVQTRVDDANYTLTNRTLGDHYFRDGTVTRSLVVTESTISVRTVGVGTNISRTAWAANYAASPYFKVLDANVRVNIGYQQLRNDVRDFFN